MDSANRVAAARLRLSDLDTYTLREMWSSDGRTEWAEEALRHELLERGASADELGAIASYRSEIAANPPPSARGTLWNYGVVGRILTMAAIACWVLLYRAIYDSTLLGFAGAIVILATYVYLLSRRTIAQGKQPLNFASNLVMYWQLIEAWLFLIGTIVAAAFSPAG